MKAALSCMMLMYLAAFARADSLLREDNPDSGLSRWRLSLPALQLELAQRLPDQTRGFFLARGFPAELADDYARSCVFQTIGRNTGSTRPITLDTRLWRVRRNAREQPILSKEARLQAWSGKGLSPSAALAFRWATFPTEQTFQPGDYNWGMIGFGPQPGETFDLMLVWFEADERKTYWIRQLSCAEDK